MTDRLTDEQVALLSEWPYVAETVHVNTIHALAREVQRWRAIAAETRHQVEFRQDGWTIAHPISERLDGSLFDCRVTITLDKPPDDLGRFWIEPDGTLTPVEARDD